MSSSDSPWQILYRLDSRQNDISPHVHVNNPCGLVCDILQVINNTNTQAKFLQLKISNPLDYPQNACQASVTLYSANGESHVVPEQPLSLSLDAHASFEMEPLELSLSDVSSAEVFIWQQEASHEDAPVAPVAAEAASAVTPAVVGAVAPVAAPAAEAVVPVAAPVAAPAAEKGVAPATEAAPVMPKTASATETVDPFVASKPEDTQGVMPTTVIPTPLYPDQHPLSADAGISPNVDAGAGAGADISVMPHANTQVFSPIANGASPQFNNANMNGFRPLEPTTPNAKQTTSKKKRTTIIIACVVGLCLVAAAAGVAVWYFHQQPQNQETSQSANTSSNDSNTSANTDSSSDTDESAGLSISCNASEPFWGIWVYQSDDKADADAYAQKLTTAGFSAISIDTKTIPDAKLNKNYAVTVGTWKDQESTKKVIKALADAGYGTFTPIYSGTIKTAATEPKTVTLECITATGSPISGMVRQDANGFVLADSDTHAYTTDELMAKNLTPAELCIAWNEPFARAGYIFSNAGIQAYFEHNCPWYKGTTRSVNLQGTPASNNELFKSYAKSREEYRPWLYLKI